MSDQRDEVVNMRKMASRCFFCRQCLSFPETPISVLKLHGFSMWAWWAQARFSWQSGSCYSFLLKCSYFIIKCTTSSVLGDRFIQWKDNGLWGWSSLSALQWDQLGCCRSQFAKGHMLLTCVYCLFLTVSPLDPWVLDPQIQGTSDQISNLKNPENFKSKLGFATPCWQLFI